MLSACQTIIQAIASSRSRDESRSTLAEPKVLVASFSPIVRIRYILAR